MRLSWAIFLLIVVFCVASSTAKKKKNTPAPPTGKGKPVEGGKKKEKHVKKEEPKKDDKANVDDEEEEESDATEKSGEDEEYGDSEDDDHTQSAPEESKSSEEFEGNFREQIQEKGIFYSLNSIKEFLKGPDYDGVEEIEDALSRQNHSEYLVRQKEEENPGKPLMPFYVVEGVNPATRRKVAQILAHRLKGLYIVNQPRISTGQVPREKEAKQAYYCMSKYMIADKAKLLLYSKPVVTESYWTEHASYIMAKVWRKAFKLPPAGSEVYKFPEDLLLPNVTFAIFNSPHPRLGKSPSHQYLFEHRMLLIYKRFTGAKVFIVRFPESPKDIADKIDLYLHGFNPVYPKPRMYGEITLAE